MTDSQISRTRWQSALKAQIEAERGAFWARPLLVLAALCRCLGIEKLLKTCFPRRVSQCLIIFCLNALLFPLKLLKLCYFFCWNCLNWNILCSRRTFVSSSVNLKSCWQLLQATSIYISVFQPQRFPKGLGIFILPPYLFWFFPCSPDTCFSILYFPQEFFSFHRSVSLSVICLSSSPV